MEYTNLSKGVKVPLLGLGTFMISPEDTERSVSTRASRRATASSIRRMPT